eukprot:gene4213-4777_t
MVKFMNFEIRRIITPTSFPRQEFEFLKGEQLMLREGDAGIILYTGESEVIPVLFKGKDCRPRENPQYGDIVKFDLVTFKRTGQFVARDVCVVQKSLPTRQLGFICALKDSYGFIEFANHEKEVFFHYSELESDPNTLNLVDEVEFSMTKRNGKASAERVVKMPLGTIQQEQDEYEGLIELSEPQKLQESSSGCEDDSTTTPTLFRFAITSLVNKKEPLLVGDKHLHSPLSPHAPNTYINAAALVNHGGLPQMNHVDANPPCTTLFVANLGSRTTEEELKGIFAGMPGYRRLKVLRNKNTTPVCFVEFYDVVTAMQARQLLNGHILRSSETGAMRIEFARNKMAGEGGMLMFAKKDILIES